MIAQSSPFEVNIQPGVRWRGPWRGGYIETNRLLYDYELVFFGRGSGRVITGRGNFSCGGGTVIIIPPGLAHCTVAETGLERWCVHFNWHHDCGAYRERPLPFVYLNSAEVFDKTLMAGPPGFELDFPFCRQLAPEEAQYTEGLLHYYFTSSPRNVAERLNQQGLLLQILAMALTAGTSGIAMEAGRGNPLFLQAKSVLDSRFREPELKLRDVAAGLRITPNHLVKLFRRHIGMSVIDYLLARRMEHAAGLLRKTTLTIREIAAESGFEDPNYFTRYFHRRYGATPTAWRKAKFKN